MLPADGFSPVLTHLEHAEQRLRSRGLVAADALAAWMHEWLSGQVPEAVRRADEATVDVVGLAYQHFLPHRFKAKLGQFFTPRPIARLMVDLLDLRSGESVLDPFAGSGGLLQLAARHTQRVQGLELDGELARFSAQALQRRAPGAVVHAVDAFAHDAHADVVLANPPFSLVIHDPDVLARHGLSDARSASSEQLFAQALHRWVGPAGRAAIVLPHSALTARSHASVRSALVSHFSVDRVCELPEGVFRPFGGAQGRAVVLWLSRGGSGETLWARIEDPGYDVSRKTPQATASTEIDRLVEGEGWTGLATGAWRPSRRRSRGVAVQTLASPVEERFSARQAAPEALTVIDLADVRTESGHPVPRPGQPSQSLKGVRRRMVPGDVCVSRLRPEKGLVTVVPPCDEPVVGSAEWVVLRTVRPHLLFHMLRTPSFRRGLPQPVGQTRPRVTASDVLQVRVRAPSEAVQRDIEALSAEWHAVRREAEARLAELQASMDAFAAGQLDEEQLQQRVAAWMRANRQPSR